MDDERRRRFSVDRFASKLLAAIAGLIGLFAGCSDDRQLSLSEKRHGPPISVRLGERSTIIGAGANGEDDEQGNFE